MISIIASIVTAWLTFQFVKRRELAEALQNEARKLNLVKKPEMALELENKVRELDLVRKPEMALELENQLRQQRELLILEDQRDRETRTRQEILRWANPILGAVEGLEARLKNILEDKLYLALDPRHAGVERPVDPDWAVSYDYTMPSTLFLFGEYFAWIRLLQARLNFELFESQETKNRFFRAIWDVTKALSSWPKDDIKGSGQDAQVFYLQQRAIGELFIRGEGKNARSITFPEFLEALNGDQRFPALLSPLSVLLEGVERGMKRWSRLEGTMKALQDLREECRDLLELKGGTERQ